MIRRPPRSTRVRSSAASDVYKRQVITMHYLHTAHSSLKTEFYDPKTFFTHAALLRQTFVHCGRFPTAASRRSLGRVSVPMWPFILSDRLLIVALVSHYLTN